MTNDDTHALFFPPDRLIAADVAIVLGCNDAIRPTERAVGLYRSGHVQKLLFTGGFNERLGMAEADAMATNARIAGVPETAILIERQARNTDENLQYACAMTGEPPAIMLVTIQFHLHRVLIAARKHFPGVTDFGWSCYPSRFYDAAEWTKSPRGRADVASEIRKIGLYYGVLSDDAP